MHPQQHLTSSVFHFSTIFSNSIIYCPKPANFASDMIVIDNTVVSDDIADQYFVCNLQACKGACCVEGDAGAPLEMDELPILDDIYETVKPYLSAEAIQTIEKDGLYEIDDEGDFCTTTINKRECVFAVYGENNILKCAIEQAHKDGKTDFQKPVSCHLYPIRITKTAVYDALNYSRWHICDAACSHGKSLKVPLYKFLKEPLIRKYGTQWYEKLVAEIEK